MSKTQLYIGTDLLDFENEVNITRQVNDYRDPDIGSNVKSYTLEIPLTQTNRPLLGFVGDVRSRVEVTDEARLILNGMEVIRGKFRILRVTDMNVRAIIEGSDWVADISGVSIKDLSWGGGDEHTFTSANVIASWTAGAGAFYRYPLVNFAELVSEGYAAGSIVYPYDFYPMWNVEDIVTKIFLEAGYTLDASGFFATTFGRSLIVDSAPVPNDDSFIIGKNMKAYVDGITDNYDNATVGPGGTTTLNFSQVLNMGSEVEDEGLDFSTANFRYTAPTDGTYRFQSLISIYSTANLEPGNYTVMSNSLTWSIRKNGSVTLETETVSGITTFDSGNSFDLDTGYIHLDQGDYVDIHIAAGCGLRNDTGSLKSPVIYVKIGPTEQYFQAVWDENCLWPGIGKSISPAEYLQDIDGVAFLKALKKAFNLRIFVDKNNKTVYIETSDDFYGTTVIDWTDKIDYDKGIEQEIISANYKKHQTFKWKPDTGDKAYTNEVSANGVPYQHKLEMDSEYIMAGTTVRENPVFSPTPLGSMPQVGHWGQKKVPAIFGSQEFMSSSKPYPEGRAKAWEPRLFEWLGLIAFTEGSFYYHDDYEDVTGTLYSTFAGVKTPDMADMYSDYMLKDWNRIEKNRIIVATLVLTPSEITKFMTVVGTAANEGFRATYKLNIEGVEMLFICSKITTDGDLVKGEFVQKM